MPTAKRQKGARKSEKAAGSSSKPAPVAPEARDQESEFAQLARQHWLKPSKRSTKVKVKNDVLKTEIWDSLERDGFLHKSLVELESLQLLESYLWPGYTDESSHHHVLLIVFLVNTKRRERLDTWGLFDERQVEFSSLFRRVLSISLDQTQPLGIRTQILSFIIYAFQSLDCTIVRKECAPLVSISIWHNLSTEEKRENGLEQDTHLRKAWRAAGKRYDAADDATKARLRFDRSWLYTLVLDFFSLLHQENATSENLMYCERFTELLIDLQSQLPTRRYVNFLLQDLHTLTVMILSSVYNDEGSGLLRDLHALLEHYTHFTISDYTGAQLSRTEAYDRRCAELAKLQRVSLKYFKEKLTVLALSNYGAIGDRGELAGLLDPLTDEESVELASLLQLRTSFPDSAKVPIDRNFLKEALLSTYQNRPTFRETIRDLSTLPSEHTLFGQNLVRADNYDGSHPLALPKLNLQYLSVGDFLWRALILYRCESFYGIRKDIETAVHRLKPQSSGPGATTFTGTSRMALPITKPTVVDVVPPLVGNDVPSAVKAEINIDLRNLADGLRRDWESLRPDDVVFLLAVDASARKTTENGGPSTSEAQKQGLLAVRSAEVIQVLDDRGRNFNDKEYGRGSSRRTLLVKLDSKMYKADMEKSNSANPEVYSTLNVLVRRSGRENNFKPVLESIRNLALTDVPLASWLHEVFLGYGDPAAATYKQLPNRLKTLDFRDTFLDWQHLVESLPGRIVEPGDDVAASFGPPYILETVDRPAPEVSGKPSKKRRRDAEPALIAEVETLKVSTYRPPNNGPYLVNTPKLNTIRFTPAQIDAIISGTQPGLTVIVGPPGTGKTDVATQIISNIYHNFPEQRTLLVAHSNQALNQLFAKIVALDIDERHLLRLGHGEEELDASGSFGKTGRVESFLKNRDKYLLEVTRLAASIGAPGAHGSSAETAGYFNSVYVQPAWTRFLDFTKDEEVTASDIAAAFPFVIFFSDAPQPLFPVDGDRDVILEVANGCYRHISKIFSELADVVPFEILRRERDKANYLLTNEARIIAMTSTHAAMRRGEIASLGFRYDNVVVEEAAQITEIESFIPLAMQKHKPGHGLQRVVLCGDHFQNSPVIQSLAFRQYANLEQSFFSRLVRLGVPTINLDQQGRARPSIAKLYQWRYKNLGNLPHVESQEEFLVANAGFKYDYQFIDVPDYKGRGESEPIPHFIQNLGEAENAVAIYQYMRLLGYPASKITILTTYAGQRALVRDVLQHRCTRSPIFGLPKAVTTVDKYQGEQNDYIILSLTRTSRVGYLRDIRRLTVALSRARLGLYIVGRRQVFESCFELRQAFELLLQRPDKLTLVTGELWPSKRRLVDEADKESVEGETVMEGLEHLGQYVFEMTQTRLNQLRAEEGLPPMEKMDFAAAAPVDEIQSGEVMDVSEEKHELEEQAEKGVEGVAQGQYEAVEAQ